MITSRNNIYFIGGSPCSGKSTIAERLSAELGAFYFKVDDYLDEFISKASDEGLHASRKAMSMTADETWMRDPAEQCRDEFAIYREISGLVLEKLNEIDSNIIVTEGAAYTPEVMEAIDYEHYLCVIPSADFQVTQYRKREWIHYVLNECSDKERAFDNWMQRDILFANQIRNECTQRGIQCITNDGLLSVEQLYDSVKRVLL